MELYGRSYTRRQIEAHTGRLEQIGGLRRFTLNEGPEAGVEQIQIRTGAGLTYIVSPSRALDISLAELGGVPRFLRCCWRGMVENGHWRSVDDLRLKHRRRTGGR